MDKEIKANYFCLLPWLCFLCISLSAKEYKQEYKYKAFGAVFLSRYCTWQRNKLQKLTLDLNHSFQPFKHNHSSYKVHFLRVESGGPFQKAILTKKIFSCLDLHTEYWDLLYWLGQSLWLCGSQETVEDSSREGTNRPSYLPPEKSVWRSRSNS